MNGVTNVSLTLEIESGNEAVVSDPCREVPRMLEILTRVLKKQPFDAQGRLNDSNGNKVGQWYWVIERGPVCPECGSYDLKPCGAVGDTQIHGVPVEVEADWLQCKNCDTCFGDD